MVADRKTVLVPVIFKFGGAATFILWACGIIMENMLYYRLGEANHEGLGVAALQLVLCVLAWWYFIRIAVAVKIENDRLSIFQLHRWREINPGKIKTVGYSNSMHCVLIRAEKLNLAGLILIPAVGAHGLAWVQSVKELIEQSKAGGHRNVDHL